MQLYLIPFHPPPLSRLSGITCSFCAGVKFVVFFLLVVASFRPVFSLPDPDASCTLAYPCTDVPYSCLCQLITKSFQSVSGLSVSCCRAAVLRDGRPTFFLSGRLQIALTKLATPVGTARFCCSQCSQQKKSQNLPPFFYSKIEIRKRCSICIP